MKLERRIARKWIRARARWKEEGWDKASPVEVLKSYATSKGIHGVHMSDLGPESAGGFKIGINPGSTYDTPSGIYTFPLNRDTFGRWFSDRKDRTPFASDRPWMYVVAASQPSKTVLVDQSGSAGWTLAEVRDVVGDLIAREPELVDRITGASSEGFFETRFWEDAKHDAKFNTPFAVLWNVLRLISEAGGNGPPTWNRLLREYADIQAVEDEGAGLIHENEPRQVLFLSSRAYELEDVVPNVWNWLSAKQNRDMDRELFRPLKEAGLDGMFDGHEAVEIFGGEGLGIREVKRRISSLGKAIDKKPDLLEILQSTKFSSRGKAAPMWTGLMGDDFTLRVQNAYVDEVDLSGEILDWFEASSTRFTDCVLAEDLASSDEDVRFNNCRFYGCAFRIRNRAFEDIVSELASRDWRRVPPPLQHDAPGEMFRAVENVLREYLDGAGMDVLHSTEIRLCRKIMPDAWKTMMFNGSDNELRIV